MNPRFARVRPDMTVDEAISYLRKQRREHVETIYYAYVLDEQQKLSLSAARYFVKLVRYA
jgi:magnesium transporter